MNESESNRNQVIDQSMLIHKASGGANIASRRDVHDEPDRKRVQLGVERERGNEQRFTETSLMSIGLGDIWRIRGGLGRIVRREDRIHMFLMPSPGERGRRRRRSRLGGTALVRQGRRRLMLRGRIWEKIKLRKEKGMVMRRAGGSGELMRPQKRRSRIQESWHEKPKVRFF